MHKSGRSAAGGRGTLGSTTRKRKWAAVLDLPALVSPSGSLAGLIAAAGRFGGEAAVMGGWHQVRMVLHRNSGQWKERR
jgi:hypothetical protein